LSIQIKEDVARKIFNSCGEKTREVDKKTKTGFGRATAPAGASKGHAEVVYYPKLDVDEFH